MTFRAILLDNLDLCCDFGSLHIFPLPLLCETAKDLESTAICCNMKNTAPASGEAVSLPQQNVLSRKE